MALYRPDDLTITAITRVLKLPPTAWEGRCYEIACAIVKANLVEGEAVYGHWLGRVANHGFWADKRHQPFQRHGWIELPDDRILDATRWSFEGVKPYVWLDNDEDEIYDRGGNMFRAAVMRPCPGHDEKCPDGQQRYVKLELSPVVRAHLHRTSGGVLFPTMKPKRLTVSQLFWLANLPYDALEPYNRSVYHAIAAVNQRCAIPIDNWERAQGEE